jgi:hypothetical protein
MHLQRNGTVMFHILGSAWRQVPTAGPATVSDRPRSAGHRMEMQVRKQTLGYAPLLRFPTPKLNYRPWSERRLP